ncbi:MAG: hypothetical protein ACOYNZ_09515 [Rhodoferax sp.]
MAHCTLTPGELCLSVAPESLGFSGTSMLQQPMQTVAADRSCRRKSPAFLTRPVSLNSSRTNGRRRFGAGSPRRCWSTSRRAYGAVNQHGEVLPLGGINEKIEGFFRVRQKAHRHAYQSAERIRRARRHRR